MTARDEILDEIIVQIGGFGKYQVFVLSCLCLVTFLHSVTHIAYVFTSMDSDYRCLVPECEKKIATDKNWLKFVIPYDPVQDKPFKCLMYEKWDNSSFNEGCSMESFNRYSVKNCTSFYFQDDEHYVAREFNLLCENKLWILSLVGTANTLGMFLGLITTGFISDRYGRKNLLIYGMCLCGLTGLVKTLSPSFAWFLVLETLEAIFSAGTCCCVVIIAVEIVVPKKRSLMGTILNTTYCMGEVFIAMLAWFCKSWKLIIYFTYTPCLLVIFLLWILPESLRWKLSKGKVKESKEALRHIAKMNNKHLPEETLDKLNNSEKPNDNSTDDTLMDVFRSKRLFWRFLNCCFSWMTCAFLFYGITLSSVSLHGNKYLDFILISLTELPAYWCGNYLIEKLGRRTSICGSYLITTISCLSFIFVSKSNPWLYLFTFCMGKFGATAAFYLIYVITSEIFPTPLRHTMMGLCSTVGRLGSVTSPQTPLLGRIWKPLPLILFATMSTIAGITSFFLPETRGIILPDNIKEAEAIE